MYFVSASLLACWVCLGLVFWVGVWVLLCWLGAWAPVCLRFGLCSDCLLGVICVCNLGS